MWAGPGQEELGQLGRPPPAPSADGLWRDVLGSCCWGLGLGRAWAGGVPPSREGWAETWLSARGVSLFGVLGSKFLSPGLVPPW